MILAEPLLRDTIETEISHDPLNYSVLESILNFDNSSASSDSDFRVWLSAKRPAPRVPGLCAGQSPSVGGPPAAISPGYCCPGLSVIGRSCGCLRDPGITWRFLGSDAAVGAGLALSLAGRSLVVCWLDCGRGWGESLKIIATP